MLQILKEQGEKNSRNSVYQFWRQDNHPEELFSIGFTWQNINYMHNNPVASGLVEKAEDYLYLVHAIMLKKGKVRLKSIRFEEVIFKFVP